MLLFLKINLIDIVIRNFYQGVRPALFGMVFYAGINFGTFESFKEIVKEKETFCGHIVKDENGELKWMVNFVLGKSHLY